MNRSRIAVCLVFLCLFTANIFAWDKPGHMTVAAAAFIELQQNHPVTLDKINELLKLHVAYNTWVGEYAGYSVNLKKEISLEAYVFMRAAAWPDDVRGQSEDRPPWHYIDYPVNPPHTIDLEHPLVTDINALVAFASQLKTLTSGGVSKKQKQDKAKSLAWILHLVGDIHQPLHGASLVNGDFPQGDAGGNGVCVEAPEGGPPIELHGYWDNILRVSSSPRENGRVAWEDAKFFRKLFNNIDIGTLTGNDGMKKWSQDSAEIALENAYQFQGALAPFKKKVHKACPAFNDSEKLTGDYEKNGVNIARRQVVTAGLRLAGILSAALP